ncbi:protein MEN-8 [Nymphaea colorata]|uniref:protein MEN-8 n=1 Tax=Nymphaea colorata TaxID=210225 RepID=UPI00129EC842|nr:protein MEN-8 [Nymphaea colorata]
MARGVQSQNCSAKLTSLTTCASYVVPGANEGRPSTQCCSALSDMDTDCLCSTLRIVAQLPNQCGLSAISCPGL